MPDKDELEIAIASGLDIPTALALTDKSKKPGCSGPLVLAIIVAVVIYWLTGFLR